MRKFLLLLSVFLFVSIHGWAANLVTNGGFETGDFTGWTTHNCTGSCEDTAWSVEEEIAYSGNYSAGNPCIGAPCNDPVTGSWIKQTLATDPTQLYSLTFAYNAYSGGATELDVYWNGALVDRFTDIASGYNVYTITGLAPGASGTALEFTGRNDPSVIFLDAVDVEATGPGSYIGAFYSSTTPVTCPTGLTAVCAANTTAGVVSAPVFVLANNSTSAITSGVITLVGGDSYQVGTIAANSSVTVVPGVSNDGQTHLSGAFFNVTGTPYNSGALGPNANSTQFTFTGQQNGSLVQSLDVCGAIAEPTFTPACTSGPSTDTQVGTTNFLGLNAAGCANCFGPALVARLTGVSSSSSALTITSGAPPSTGAVAVPYGPFTLTASGGSGTYTWTASGVPGLSANSTSGVLSGTPTTSGGLTLTVTATDAENSSSFVSQNYPVSIAPAVAPLTITSGAPPSNAIWEQAYGPFTLTGAGGSGSYRWSATGVAGVTVNPTTGVLSGTPTSVGSGLTLVVTLTDTVSSGSITAHYSISVSYPPLTITSGPPPASGTVGQPYGPFTATATGGSGSYLWSASGIQGVTINGATGALSGTPTAASTSVTITVTDTVAGLTTSQSYAVNVASAALMITNASLPNGIEGQPYAARLAAMGGSGSYSWMIGGVAGLSVNANTGVISGSPTVGGSLTLTVTLTDAMNPGATPATRPYTIGITFASLTITSPSALGGFAPGAPISTTFGASGGSQPYAWSATGMPAGFTLNPSTGQLTGNAPTKPGNYMFPLTVADSEMPAASNSTTVALSVLGFTNPSTLPGASSATSYSLNFIGAGGTPPYQFSSSNLPAGLTLAASGFLSGTPTSKGTVSFNVQIADANNLMASGAFSLTVGSGAQPLQVTGVALPDGTVTTSYSQVLEAQDGKPPYTWMVIGGALPPGLSLSGSGTISGTPTAIGLGTFTARATDSSGAFAAGVFTIMVDPMPLQVISAALPTAIVGLPYGAQPIVATGGVPPYTYAITQGSLPAPLTFSTGQVDSGVPTAAGATAFTVTATDSSGDTASQAFTLTVEPSEPDLVLSQATVSFTIVGNPLVLPPAANVTVASSVSASLGYTVQTAPAAPWLDITPGSSTPATIVIALDPANAPTLAPGNYSTTLTVACLPFNCAAAPHTIAVSLTVSAPAPQLTLGTTLLSFAATGVGSQTPAQPLNLQNTGGGVINIQSVTASNPWVTFLPGTIPTALSAGQSAQVQVAANTALLSGPGYYQSTITVTSDAGSATVPVTLLIAANASMALSPAGSQFQTVAGNAPGDPDGSLLVVVSGSSTVNWTAAVTTPAASWLTLNTPSGMSTAANPGMITFSINPSVASLKSQTAYATIEVTAAGSTVVDPVQDYQIVLNVTPATNITQPYPDPQGLIFISTTGGSVPAQTVQIFASSPGISYSAMSDSPAWLSVSPASGMTSAAGPAQSSVSVNPAGLSGVLHGSINYSIAGQVRSVNVTLIVTATAPHAVSGKATPSCTPSQLIPTQTGLVNNFSLPTAWPTPLEITVNDDCGTAITSGQVVTTFSNGDPPLLLPATGTSTGVYSGTWTPRASASQVTITAQAAAQGFKAASVQITGQVTRNGAPVLNAGGSLNAFIPQLGAPLAPGMIVQIYGANLASQVTLATSVPLPTTLNNTTVLIGGVMAPLYYVSPGQINAQVPFELTPGGSYQVIVNANGALSTPNAIQVAVDSPGIAAFASGGIIAEHESGTLISDASPAMPGEYIIFFVSGMGPTNNTVASGTASPSSPLATPTDPPTLTLNGVNVPVSFAGLTPTLVGLYQVNFQVPANTPNGDLQLVLTQSGGQSNTTVLAVHN